MKLASRNPHPFPLPLQLASLVQGEGSFFFLPLARLAQGEGDFWGREFDCDSWDAYSAWYFSSLLRISSTSSASTRMPSSRYSTEWTRP